VRLDPARNALLAAASVTVRVALASTASATSVVRAAFAAAAVSPLSADGPHT
jgi:hypothetical protein